MVIISKEANIDLDTLQAMRKESLCEGFDFIDRLCKEWALGNNRFELPGEAFFIVTANGQVVGVCGLNQDPYTRTQPLAVFAISTFSRRTVAGE